MAHILKYFLFVFVSIYCIYWKTFNALLCFSWWNVWNDRKYNLTEVSNNTHSIFTEAVGIFKPLFTSLNVFSMLQLEMYYSNKLYFSHNSVFYKTLGYLYLNKTCQLISHLKQLITSMRYVIRSSLYRIAVLIIFATYHINQSINVTFADQLDMEIIEWNTISYLNCILSTI